MRIAFESSDEARAGIEAVGRTEDLLFSPDGKRLAIVGFTDAKLLVLEVEALGPRDDGYDLRFGRALTVNSNTLAQPHGVAWLDDETLIVANRKAQVPVLRVPRRLNAPDITAYPLVTLGLSAADFIHSPGSISARPLSDDLVEVMICNNFAHYVTRHLLSRSRGFAPVSSQVAMRDGLKIPDGVVYSASGRRVAVSSHADHTVLIYDTAELGRVDKPVGVLRGVAFPHGLRFTPDDRGMVVADAGAPYVFVFASRDGEWHGVHQPTGMIEVIDRDAFLRGHVNPEEGGPKGIALSPDGAVMFVTCEEEPLAVFDIREDMKRFGLMPYGSPPPAEAPPPLAELFGNSLAIARDNLEQAMAASAGAKAQAAAAEAKVAAIEAKVAAAEARARAAEAQVAAAASRVSAADARNAMMETKAKVADAKVAEEKARLSLVRGRVRNLEAKLSAADAETKKLLQSASWRITAPLRAIRRRLKGRR